MSIRAGKILVWEIKSAAGDSCGVYLKGSKHIGAGTTLSRAFADFGNDIAEAYQS